MNRNKENDILETTLSIAEKGYLEAYYFLRGVYQESPQNYGPQTLYFLACLAGGADMPEEALDWLRKSIYDNKWWYRPEVLEDDDLAALKNDKVFLALKSISEDCYARAVVKSKAVFSWEKKTADNLFLAIHGNTQNGEMARTDWEPIVGGDGRWQMETIQSGEPDGYGTYRWSYYDRTSYLLVARSMERVQNEGYHKIACGGFSAGCDMLLRAVTFTAARCDLLLLQSPWIPVLQEHTEDLIRAISQKKMELRIFCGSEDEDCLPMAEQLYDGMKKAGVDVALKVQPNTRHQFPAEVYHLEEKKYGGTKK